MTLAELKRGDYRVAVLRDNLEQSGKERYEGELRLKAVVDAAYTCDDVTMRLTYLQNSTAIKVRFSLADVLL